MVASENTQQEQALVTIRAQEHHIIAVDVSADDYMAHYAESHTEWLNGTVYAMSPIHIRHNLIVRYLSNLLDVYFELNPIGTFQTDPFVMKIEEDNIPIRRQPDIQVILGDNIQNLKETYMDGPADICIEVLSEGSTSVDLGDKFVEYESAGVQEYWIIDPIRQQVQFNRLTESSYYQRIDFDAIYQSPLLAKLKIDVNKLWQDPLPKPTAIVQAVQDMLNS